MLPLNDTLEYEFVDKETDIEGQALDSADNNCCDNLINYCNNYGKLYLTCITWISMLLIMVMALGSAKSSSDQLTSGQYCFCPRKDCVNECLNSTIWEFV